MSSKNNYVGSWGTWSLKIWTFYGAIERSVVGSLNYDDSGCDRGEMLNEYALVVCDTVLLYMCICVSYLDSSKYNAFPFPQGLKWRAMFERYWAPYGGTPFTYNRWKTNWSHYRLKTGMNHASWSANHQIDKELFDIELHSTGLSTLSHATKMNEWMNEWMASEWLRDLWHIIFFMNLASSMSDTL